MEPDQNFDHWWAVLSTLEEKSDERERARLIYMFGVLEGLDQYDKITDEAVRAAIAEVRKKL